MSRQLIRTIAHLAVFIFLGTTTSAACGIGVIHQCSMPDDVPHCTGATTYARCSKTENGGELLISDTCPSGRTCNSATGTCDGLSVGGACTVDVNCADNLRCKGGVCGGPNPTEVARCESAPAVTIPSDGTAVSVEVIFTGDTDLANEIYDGVCQTSGSARSPIRKLGLLQVHRTDSAGEVALSVEIDGAANGPNTQLFGFPPCSALYDPIYFRGTCTAPTPWTTGYVRTVLSDFVIFFGLADEQMSSARYLLKKI